MSRVLPRCAVEHGHPHKAPGNGGSGRLVYIKTGLLRLPPERAAWRNGMMANASHYNPAQTTGLVTSKHASNTYTHNKGSKHGQDTAFEHTAAQQPQRCNLPSVSLALPPVGVQSTVWQLGHSTTVCEWLNTVVLWGWAQVIEGSLHAHHSPIQAAPCVKASSITHTYMLKQPWHLTSMKYELGDCTKRFSLCLRFSTSGEGLRRSISHASTCDRARVRLDCKAA